MRIAVLHIALLAGCDLVYGLSGPVIDASVDVTEAGDADPCPNDRDCDLVLDPIDNCGDLPNPDQDDIDDDGIGDRCDACSVAPSSADEDLDGIADDVDNCPHVTNADQLDGDGDSIGTACDPNPSAADALSCFFGFGDVSETTRLWSVAKPWSTQSSRLDHQPAAATPSAVSHPPSGAITLHDAYELVARVQIATILSMQVGIGLGEHGAATNGVRCVLDGTSGSASVTLLDPAGGVLARAAFGALGVEQQIAFRFVRQGSTTALTCSIKSPGGAPVVVTANTPLPDDVTTHLISENANSSFLSLAIFRLGP